MFPLTTSEIRTQDGVPGDAIGVVRPARVDEGESGSSCCLRMAGCRGYGSPVHMSCPRQATEVSGSYGEGRAESARSMEVGGLA
jgi:hypothetical protein